MARRRSGVVWVLGLLFLVLPLVELYVLIQVGQVIGAWWTILLLVLDSLLGAWLVRREGSRAWQALRTALAEGRMPHRELTDAGLVLVGGTLLMTPGFVTDVVAVLLVLPITRPLFRRLLARLVAARVVTAATGGPRTARRPGTGSGPVVRGEVVDPPD
jgi:UPF0716 protein FxsA